MPKTKPGDTTFEADPAPLTEAEKVEQWRLHCLLQAGWTVVEAETIAIDLSIDLHHACELVSRFKCDPKLACKILS